MRCAPRPSNGPNHIGLCALQDLLFSLDELGVYVSDRRLVKAAAMLRVIDAAAASQLHHHHRVDHSGCDSVTVGPSSSVWLRVTLPWCTSQSTIRMRERPSALATCDCKQRDDL